MSMISFSFLSVPFRFFHAVSVPDIYFFVCVIIGARWRSARTKQNLLLEACFMTAPIDSYPKVECDDGNARTSGALAT